MMTFLELLNENPWAMILTIFIVGLCFGSFFNVLIFRLPKMLECEWRKDCLAFLNQAPEDEKKEAFNLCFPSSFCPKCKNKIRFYHNIPVLSFLFLKGKCAFCQVNVSIRYPIVELITALLALFCYFSFGLTPHFFASTLLVWTLLCLCYIDYDTQYLPDSLTLSLLWCGLLINLWAPFVPIKEAIYGALFGYLSLWSINQIFYLITKKVGMGNGDFKLFAALGAWLGYKLLLPVILIASFLGAIIGISYLKFYAKDNDTPIPFGPYLCLGGFIAFFWGNDLVSWYIAYALR